MPGSFDLSGMFATLQGRYTPAPPAGPMEALAAAKDTARLQLSAFQPAPPEPAEPVVRDHRPGR